MDRAAFNRGRRRRQAAKGLAATFALLVLAAEGSALEAVIPGPDVVEAGLIAAVTAIAILLAIGPFVLADFAAERRAGLAEGHASFVGIAIAASLLIAAVSGSLLWLVLAATGSLLALPVARFVIGFASLTLLGVTGKRSGDPLDDAALRLRLMRFAREAGVSATDVRVRRRPERERAFGRVPQVEIEGTEFAGQHISVPVEILRAPAGVIETAVAQAIVGIRHRVMLSRSLRTTLLEGGLLGVVALTSQDALMRLTGTTGVGAPGFFATVIALLFGMRLATGLMKGMWEAPEARRFAREALDLTRDPDSLDAAAAYATDVWWIDAEPHLPVPLRRLFGDVAVAPSELIAIAAEWRAQQRAALLFTDVVGSTDLVSRLGDRRWNEILADHDHLIREVASGRGAKEIDNPGDGFVFEFADVGRAVIAASEMQRGLLEVEVEPDLPLPVRMGVHAGDVIRRGTTVVGREVHLAARIAAAAGTGEILVAAPIASELESAGRFRFGAPRSITLKGFDDQLVVLPVEWFAAVAAAS